MVIMMSACGLQIRWDQPHGKWERAKVTDYHAVTCKRCLG